MSGPEKNPTRPNVDTEQARREGGSASFEWNAALVASVVAAAYSPSGFKPDGSGANLMTSEMVRATRAALASMAPADEAEAMLAAQVIAAHAGMMDALRRAAHPTLDDVAVMWERAADLGRTMVTTLDALDRRRDARKAPSGGHGPVSPAASEAPVNRPPPLPPGVKPKSPDALDAATVLTNEELLSRGGYRTPPGQAGYGYEVTPIPGGETPKPTE